MWGLDEPTLVIWLLFFDNNHSFEKFYKLRFTIITSTSRWLKMYPRTVYVSNKGAVPYYISGFFFVVVCPFLPAAQRLGHGLLLVGLVVLGKTIVL